MKEKGIPAVGYLRRSTEKTTQGESLPSQRADILALAERMGYTIIRWYIDDGVSGGKTEKRLDFRQMREDVGRGDFKAVLAWDMPRLSREDSFETGFWVHPFRQAHILFVTVKEGVIDFKTSKGRMLLGITQEAGSYDYLANLSRVVCRGMVRAVMERGEFCGPAPYGYLREKKKLILDAAEIVAVVRWIFEMYASSSISARGLAMNLNSRNVPPPSAGRQNVKSHRARGWSIGTILKILRCETYLGRTCYGKTTQSEYTSIAGGKIEQRAGEEFKPNV